MSKYWNMDVSDEKIEEEQNEGEHIEVQHQAPTVKPSLARRIKKTYKVKRFKSECTICPAPADSPFRGRTFSITEGFSAIWTRS